MKKFLSILLIISLILGMTSVTIATSDFIDDQENCVIERQSQLLHELQELIQTSQLIVPRSLYGVEIPNINLIAAPLDSQSQFLIGLEVEHDFNYGEWEAIEYITSQSVPEDIVDFILSFADIPAERALVGYNITIPTPMLLIAEYEDFYFPEVCPVWGHNRTTEHYGAIDSLYYITTPLIDNSFTLRMGWLHAVQIPGGFGVGTIGNPRNTAGSLYNTALHRSDLNNHNVFLNSNRTLQIGRVTRSVFNNSVDAAQVDVGITRSRVLNDLPIGWSWPGGSSLRYHMASARQNDLVRSIRGMSGVFESRVDSINATTAIGRTNQTLTFPNGSSQVGDSGAALIRVSDSAVVGIRFGTTTLNGRTLGVYTNPTLF